MKKNLRKKHLGKYGLHNTYVISCFIILIGLAFDQLTKLFSVYTNPQKLEIIPQILWFTNIKNTGAGFGLFQGQTLLLGILGIIVALLLGIYIFHKRKSTLESIIYSLVISGALGNAIDRIVFGFVTDFIDLGWWPVFNIADCLLVIGILSLIVLEIIKKEK